MRKPSFLSAGRRSGSNRGQRLGDAVADRAGLAREAAAHHGDSQVVLGGAVDQDQRLTQDHAQHGPGEIDVERLAVDGRDALAGLDPDAGDRVLALAGGVGATVLVELLDVDRSRRAPGRGPRSADRPGRRAFSAMGHALRLFLGLSLATSSTSRLSARHAGGPALCRRAGCRAAERPRGPRGSMRSTAFSTMRSGNLPSRIYLAERSLMPPI